MASSKPKPNEPHDKFIKQFVPVVLKNLFESQTSVSVQLAEELAIDILCTAIRRERPMEPDPNLGLLGRLVTVHPTIIIEHYSGYLDLEDIDSCISRSAIYWELNKGKSDNSRKIRVTKASAINPNPLHLDRPFTWIFTAKCGENSLRRWNATPALEFGAHVYRLAAPGLSMGIVELESLRYNADTMLLKMLGKAESAKMAFADILKLDPKLELRNDIIEVSIKYCIYLEQQERLTEEDISFMAYAKEVEEAYQEWVKKRRAEGKLEGIREGKLEGIREGKLEGIREGKLEGMLKSVKTAIRAKFGSDTLTSQVSDRLHQLNEQQLDEFTSKIFEWQQPTEMVAWLETSSL
ncbi:MAG: hypothetical protein KME17_02665 [Cyanosarcina radialis HA8281-LM2]|jgi:hypothetical protein|nr:hypothetical protein [Cyanosarcina radialis HA8281-LM2]